MPPLIVVSKKIGGSLDLERGKPPEKYDYVSTFKEKGGVRQPPRTILGMSFYAHTTANLE